MLCVCIIVSVIVSIYMMMAIYDGLWLGGRQWQTTAELLPRKPDDEGKTYVPRYGT